MRVLITGGTGMIGASLSQSLLVDGHKVCILTRRSSSTHSPSSIQWMHWDGRTTAGWGTIIEEVDAVINLVGERLAKWPWTKRFKQRLWNSRVDGGRALTEAIQKSPKRPAVLIQASGINYYGPHGQEIITEADPPGNDFLAQLSRAWEDSTKAVEELGVRRAIIRSAIVLDGSKGILPIMALPVRLFVGGPLGSGRQGLPWIHLADEVAAIRFLLERDTARGPFNLTSPEPISSAVFLRQIAAALRRPFWLPAPAAVLRLALGEMGALVLAGAYALPRRLVDLGFQFKYGEVSEALQEIFPGRKYPKPTDH
jgi:uncharacterized protein (TIGR01777 family)